MAMTIANSVKWVMVFKYLLRVCMLSVIIYVDLFFGIHMTQFGLYEDVFHLFFNTKETNTASSFHRNLWHPITLYR
jgi:hypothetical protein